MKKAKLKDGKIVDVYFTHADGIAYVGDNGVVILFEGEYELI